MFTTTHRAMTTDQREVFRVLTENILKQAVNCYLGKISVIVCALIEVEARLASGSTLHTTLKLSVQNYGRITQMPMLMEIASH